MNTLIVCNTFFQLIVAAQIKLTIKKDDKVTLIISDHTKSLFLKSQLIKSTNIFDSVLWYESKKNEGSVHNKFKYIKSRIDVYKGSSFDLFSKNDKFDEIIAYNLDYFTLSLFRYFKKRNKTLVFNSFEEGILCYGNTPYLYKDIFRDKIFKKYLINDKLQQSFYCFFPEVYEGDLTSIKLNLVDRDNQHFREFALQIFGRDLIQNVKEKIIIFTSVYDFEGGECVGEINFIEKISKMIGSENIILKVHPRDNQKRFIEKGFSIFPHSEIPWEFFQLFNDYSNKIFISTLSGSPMFVNLISSNKAVTLFVNDLFHAKNNSAFKTIEKSLKNILSCGKLDTSFCYNIENFDYLVSLLKEKI